MTTGFETVRISLKQADGEHYPLFHRGDPDTRNLALVPATEGQAEADIQFFHHPTDGSRPEKLGTIRFPDLPGESTAAELQLDAVIGSTGLFSVTVRHPDSGRVERLEMELPDEQPESSELRVSSSGWRNRPERWVFGALFVIAALALILFLTFLVTDWGREEPVPAPLSLLVEPDSTERT